MILFLNKYTAYPAHLQLKTTSFVGGPPMFPIKIDQQNRKKLFKPQKFKGFKRCKKTADLFAKALKQSAILKCF